MGIDFSNKRGFPQRNKNIKSQSANTLTRGDLLFLQSLGLRVKKQQWRRLKN